jgi:hypothetical protein
MPQSELAHLEMLAEIDSLVERLRRWADDAPAWQAAEKCRALVRRLIERSDSLRIRLDAPLVVATLGGSGTGKSALVNALVGAEVVQTGRSRPTTMRPTLVCRPDLTPEMLGIDPASVERIECGLPALRDLVLIDCPDPDTTEEEARQSQSDEVSPSSLSPLPSPLGPPSDNLARLRAILPKCDVLLVTGTQQKYRSARVAEELVAAARGAQLVFVQTHADRDADVRDDWRKVLEKELEGKAEGRHFPNIFRIDSLRALADARANLQPRGEFADLLDLLTRQMAGAAGNRIRRANFLDLVAGTLESCQARVDQSLPNVRETLAAIDEQRRTLANQLAGKMQSELLANRRQWENRLLGQVASRWGFSPFALVLRVYQGLGGLFSGALLYRARTPAQVALWGALEGMRTLRRHQKDRQADRSVDRVATGGWEPAELRKASLIVEGYAADAGLGGGQLGRSQAETDADRRTAIGEAGVAATAFVAGVAGDLESLIARLARRHTGWFTRWRYEILLAVMIGLLLFRLGKNFFYDSWLAAKPEPVFGLDFYVSAGFWLLLWCLLLLWSFCSRLRGGLRGEITQLAAGWNDPSRAAALFAHVEDQCRRVERFRQELDAIRQEVTRLQRQMATG